MDKGIFFNLFYFLNFNNYIIKKNNKYFQKIIIQNFFYFLNKENSKLDKTATSSKHNKSKSSSVEKKDKLKEDD